MNPSDPPSQISKYEYATWLNLSLNLSVNNLVPYNVAWSSILFDSLGEETSRNDVVGLEAVSEGGHQSIEGVTDEHKFEVVLQSVLDLPRRVSSLTYTHHLRCNRHTGKRANF